VTDPREPPRGDPSELADALRTTFGLEDADTVVGGVLSLSERL
jgi:hypothetical protein